jgi:hypothetical protein
MDAISEAGDELHLRQPYRLRRIDSLSASTWNMWIDTEEKTQESSEEQEVLGRNNRPFSSDTTRVAYNTTPPTIFCRDVLTENVKHKVEYKKK